VLRSYGDPMSTEVSERAALVALLRERPESRSWAGLTVEILAAGSAVTAWDALVDQPLVWTPGAPDPRQVAAADLAVWDSQGHRLVTVLDNQYPARLRGIHQVPPVLFWRGGLRPDDRAVSVVGSRDASAKGLELARDIAAGLVEHGLTVVAGLAAGIDTAAHRAALDAGGRTVAFIATGITRVYPPANRDLHEEIAARGMLASQFWPDAPPQKHTFIQRNATMSGYGLATVVVEAGEFSGTRSQARMAVEHGRPVILLDSVARKTLWGQELLGRPGVRVAASANEILTAVQEITAQAAEFTPKRLVELATA